MSKRMVTAVTWAAVALIAVAAALVPAKAGASLRAKADEGVGQSSSPLTAGTDVRVFIYGSGRGFVDGSGFNCGRQCSANFTSQQRVSLQAHPYPGSRFDHWVYACGANPRSPYCSFNAGDITQVGAVFQTAVSVSVSVSDVTVNVETASNGPLRRFHATFDVPASSVVTYELRQGGTLLMTWSGNPFTGHSRRGIWIDNRFPAGNYQMTLRVTTGTQVQVFNYNVPLPAPPGN
jgi:hypothetical protein